MTWVATLNIGISYYLCEEILKATLYLFPFALEEISAGRIGIRKNSILLAIKVFLLRI